MADFSSQGGAAGGDWNRAVEMAKSATGQSSPSSGLVNWLAFGKTEYSTEEAQQYGLPLTSRHTTELREKAIAPALESYRASKPEVGQAFDIRTGQLEAEKDPLKERYANLLAQLTGRETKETGAQAKYLSQEYGKRGIPLSSGAYQQDLTGKLGDISQFYATQGKDVGLAQEADLRDLSNQISNLTTQRVAAMRDIDNKIAELQAGAGNQAVTDALQSYREDLNRKFESRFDDLNRQIEQQKLQPTYSSVDLGKGQYSTFNPQTGQYGNVTTLQQQTGGVKKYKVVGGS